jgi:hypothetical protein
VPRGPKGERRPADVIGNAVHVMRIATGEVEETTTAPDPAKEHMRRGGLKMDDLVALVDAHDAAQPRKRPGRKPKVVTQATA